MSLSLPTEPASPTLILSPANRLLCYLFRKIPDPMEVHKGIIHSIEADFSQKRVVTACSDGLVRVFNRGGEEPCELAMELELDAGCGPVTKAIFLNQGELIASSYFSGRVVVWKYEGGRFSKRYEKEVVGGSVNDISARWCGTSFVLYCACSDGNVRILSIDGSFNATETDVFCHRFGVSSVCATENGFVSGGMDYSSAVWEDTTETARFRDHRGFVRDVAVCPANCFKIFCMASSSEDGRVIIYTKRGDGYESQVIDIGEPCYSLSWSVSGFSLCVGYGESKFKCFVPDSSGKFKEVGLEKIGN